MMMQKLQSDASHAHLGGAGNPTVKNIGGGGVQSDNDPANMSQQQQHSVLNAFDFAAIDEMDPALCNY
jgi:hypothetical protein